MTIGPYTIEEANEERAKGKTIHACWWCLNETSKPHLETVPHKHQEERPYWKAEELVFIGHRNACPNHKNPADRKLP